MQPSTSNHQNKESIDKDHQTDAHGDVTTTEISKQQQMESSEEYEDEVEGYYLFAHVTSNHMPIGLCVIHVRSGCARNVLTSLQGDLRKQVKVSGYVIIARPPFFHNTDHESYPAVNWLLH